MVFSSASPLKTIAESLPQLSMALPSAWSWWHMSPGGPMPVEFGVSSGMPQVLLKHGTISPMLTLVVLQNK